MQIIMAVGAIGVVLVIGASILFRIELRVLLRVFRGHLKDQLEAQLMSLRRDVHEEIRSPFHAERLADICATKEFRTALSDACTNYFSSREFSEKFMSDATKQGIKDILYGDVVRPVVDEFESNMRGINDNAVDALNNLFKQHIEEIATAGKPDPANLTSTAQSIMELTNIWCGNGGLSGYDQDGAPLWRMQTGDLTPSLLLALMSYVKDGETILACSAALEKKRKADDTAGSGSAEVLADLSTKLSKVESTVDTLQNSLAMGLYPGRR